MLDGYKNISLAGFLFFFIFTVTLCGNPMMPQHAVVSEFKFDDGSDWILEIGFLYSSGFGIYDYDSIAIKTSSGYSRINTDNLTEGITEFLITRDSLPFYVNINRAGDYITVLSYRKDTPGYILVDSLSFGNFPGSMLPGLLPVDYSICRIVISSDENDYNFLCRDKSPTIGLPNDESGTTGILTGKIYDKYNKPVTAGNLRFDYRIVFDTSGTYKTDVLSRKVFRDYIYKDYGFYWITLRSDTLSFDIYPDSAIYLDIHLRDYVVGIEDAAPPENYDIEIINYPNPFNSVTNFFVSIPRGLIYEKAEINIYDINGERISTIPVKENTRAQWTGVSSIKPVASGIYFYQLSLDNIIYKTGSMILLK